MRGIVERLVVRSAIAAACVLAMVPGLAGAMPPDPPSAAMIRADLDQLTVRSRSDEPYDRDAQFGGHWTTRGGCTTRERVLLRDGLNAKKGPGCTVSATHWRSVYDGVIVTSSRMVQIDHIVPLKNAFHSGAAAWTRQQRVAFANDLADPQLIASTVHANESKATAARRSGCRASRRGACTRAGGSTSRRRGGWRSQAPRSDRCGSCSPPADRRAFVVAATGGYGAGRRAEPSRLAPVS